MFDGQIPYIRPMSERVFEMIPVDAIEVPNPRKRNEKLFQETMRSIREVGLRKPICVNAMRYEETGKYTLIFGQGRLEIHILLGMMFIMAEILKVDEGTAYILSLVENIARVRPSSIEFARTIVDMHDSGVTIAELVKITGRSRSDLYDCITLMKNGEERLIQGVEDGIYTISFAKNVARADDALTQKLIVEAVDSRLIAERHIELVKKIIDSRKNKPNIKPIESLGELKNELRDITKKMEMECEQAEKKENRLYRLLNALKIMKESKEFMQLMKKSGISKPLKLQGKYPDYQ